jgi:hypothetical protein
LFFEAALGFARRFLRESGDCGELESGEITLAFASCDLGSMNFPEGLITAGESSMPLVIEIALVTPAVVEAHAHALTPIHSCPSNEGHPMRVRGNPHCFSETRRSVGAWPL